MLAIKIDANAALRSASFGLGQIIGFNHKAAGYALARRYGGSLLRLRGGRP